MYFILRTLMTASTNKPPKHFYGKNDVVFFAVYNI